MAIKFTIDVYNKVKEMSQKINMPMSQCVNMLVTQWLKDNK